MSTIQNDWRDRTWLVLKRASSSMGEGSLSPSALDWATLDSSAEAPTARNSGGAWVRLIGTLCQQGLANLLCRFSVDRSRCFAVAKVTGEIQRARASGGLLFALGVATDAWQMKKAINRSFETGTVRPAAAQATRSLTTWGAVWAGAELLGLGGALLGIETGPGVVVTSSVGAIVGGCIGLFASDWLARKIDDVRLEVTAEKSFTRYRVE